MLWWPDGLETAPRKAIAWFFQVFARFLYVNAFPDSQSAPERLANALAVTLAGRRAANASRLAAIA